MRTDVQDILASQFTTHRIVRQLHDVPPHEVYEIFVDGRRAVVKVDTGPTGNAGTEGHVIAFVGAQTSVPVPEILQVGDDHFVAEWHPAAPAPEKDSEGDETWAYGAGRGLATLHDETDPLVDEYGRFCSPDDGLSVEGYEDGHLAAIAYNDRHRSVLAQHDHSDVADIVGDFLDDHPGAFDGADGPVCCHGWATPEHVAVVDGEIACLVDFEHAIAAPSEFDYWRTVLPTFRDDASTRSFRVGYESVRPLPASVERRKPLYVLLNHVYYLESLYVQDQHGPDGTAERAEWFRDRITETIDRLT